MKKKLSILIYSLGSGGAERVVATLLEHLKRDYDITLVLMSEIIFYDIPSDIKISYIEKSTPPENGIWKLIKLPILGWRYRGFLKKNNIDISLSFMNRPNYINVIAKILNSGSKTILSERTAPSGEYSSNSIRDKISRLLIRLLYPKADSIIPNSKVTLHELNTLFDIPKSKMRVIYNPLDIDRINKMKEESIDIQKSKFTFVNIGRFEEQKNHILLIKAFALSKIDAELWLIGDGYLRQNLEEEVKRLKISDKIKFLGKQKNPYKYLNRADCFIFASKYEGFPNVILEALACSLPIISTDCKSGPREILCKSGEYLKETNSIELCEYGILTANENISMLAKAINIIFDDDKLQYNYRLKAKKAIVRYSIENIIKEWNTLLKEI